MALPARKIGNMDRMKRATPLPQVTPPRNNRLHPFNAPGVPNVNNPHLETKHPILLRIVKAVAQRAWTTIPTVRYSTPGVGGTGAVGGAGGAAPAGTPPGGTPPTRPPDRPTDNGPQFAFPKRSGVFKRLPYLATAALLGYLVLRIYTFTTIPMVSFVAAIALFLAELHCVTNGLQYQTDEKNESRYDQWKADNWPSKQQIDRAVSPEGPRTAMQIASAGEEPSTVWPTVYGTMEMEGNKQVIWNSQANVLWSSITKPKTQTVDGYLDAFIEWQNRKPSMLEALEKKYPQHTATWQNIRRQLTNVENLDLRELENLHAGINQQIKGLRIRLKIGKPKEKTVEAYQELLGEFQRVKILSEFETLKSKYNQEDYRQIWQFVDAQLGLIGPATADGTKDSLIRVIENILPGEKKRAFDQAQNALKDLQEAEQKDAAAIKQAEDTLEEAQRELDQEIDRHLRQEGMSEGLRRLFTGIIRSIPSNSRSDKASEATRINALAQIHKMIGNQLKQIDFMEKQRLVDNVNAEYKTVWDWISGQVRENASGTAPVDVSNWVVPNQTERNERVQTVGNWKTLTQTQKAAVLSNIYRMLGRRFITRGGLWTWWGSERENVPNDLEFEKLLHKVFFGSLRTSGEVEETGLGEEVDIAPYGYVDQHGTFHAYRTNLDKLVQKVKEYMNTPGASRDERLLFAFDYMRDLIGMDKREQKAANMLEYFPRNVRSGGEDIKMGLEYETQAEECRHWQASDLDYQFERLVNTYSNSELTWWDRDRFSELDHGGRKSNSINSLVHHLAGHWYKVVETGKNHKTKDVAGYVVAADTYSGLMRVFLENLENGQYIWDLLRVRPGMDRNQLNNFSTVKEVVDRLETELQGVYTDHEVNARRWVFINAFLKKLTTAGNFSETNLTAVLRAEGMLPANIPVKLSKEIRRAAKWLSREKSVEGQRKILHYFFDQGGIHLDLRPRQQDLEAMVKLAFADKQYPATHQIVEEYNFDEIKYFTNIDAEVRPRPDFMARTVSLLDKLIEQGEVPPRMTLTDKILWKLFKRQPGGKIKAGFLQVPQFYTIDPETGEPLHFTAHVDQRLFYQSIQPSKSLNDGTFSCGSNVVYHLASKRETSERLFTEPGAKNIQELGELGPKDAPQPGGWSYRYSASEIYVKDRNGNLRPMVAYQTAESPTEDHASTVHFLDYEKDKKAERKKAVYLNDILGKGEAPKDLNNLSGKQHPKWAGGTIGDFFYIILPRYLRWIPGNSFMAQQMLKVVNAVPAPIRNAGKTVVKAGDSIFFRIPIARQLWRFAKILGKVGNHLTWETAMSHKPKMAPFSKVGLEFFRSGTWYIRGMRDLILIGAPVLLTTSILGSALAGMIFTGAFTPILINPAVFLVFFGTYLATTLTSYLYSTKRLGQKVIDVMFKKEAVLLGQGWPGYLHADFWGLMGPSGRLGATTTKGVGGREHLTSKYALPSLLAGIGSLAGAGVGTWLLANSVYFLGAGTAFSGPGIGILLCTIWALYHAGMIFRGFGISQSLNSTVGQKYIDWVSNKAQNANNKLSKLSYTFLEDFLLTWRGIGFTVNKTLFKEPTDKFYGPKSLKNLLPHRVLNILMRNSWARKNGNPAKPFKQLKEKDFNGMYKLFDEKFVPAAIRKDSDKWTSRINPLIVLGKLVYGLLGWFRRPEKW
jgi:hypothetical protein